MRYSSRSYNFFHRLKLAIIAFFIALKRERHLKLHIILTVVLLMPLIWIKIDQVKIMILVILLGALVSAEMFNSSIEIIVDLITRKYSYRAKLAKDMSSSAVLIVGMLLFIYTIFIYGPTMYNFVIGDVVGY